MDVKVLEKSEKKILLELRGVDLGFTYAIVKELLKDQRVLNAWSRRDHPLEPQIKFFILTDGSINPKEALDNALSKIRTQLEQLKEKFLEEVKVEA